MPNITDIHKILILGSGPIGHGQVCKRDSSGTQACRALKQEGFEVILVNSNPATIMTDPELIEKADFYKGFARGKVGLSTNHTLAIINRGNAHAQEILDFECDIQNKVKERFHIELQPEPVFV